MEPWSLCGNEMFSEIAFDGWDDVITPNILNELVDNFDNIYPSLECLIPQ